MQHMVLLMPTTLFDSIRVQLHYMYMLELSLKFDVNAGCWAGSTAGAAGTAG